MILCDKKLNYLRPKNALEIDGRSHFDHTCSGHLHLIFTVNKYKPFVNTIHFIKTHLANKILVIFMSFVLFFSVLNELVSASRYKSVRNGQPLFPK